MMRFCKFLTSRAFGALVLVVVQFAIIIVDRYHSVFGKTEEGQSC